ncbi:hypothetical protein ACWD4O_38930 [Streptomyces sp. NPDC002623]
MAKHLVSERQQAIRAWLIANGIVPNHIPVNADITIEAGPDQTRVIVYEAFDLDADGYKQLDELGTGAALNVLRTPLLVEPPEWWKPYVKPSRDTLLAATDRVRALHVRNVETGACEHCSAGDYPNYDVHHPCATIKALDGP